jgi:hypothetical protein
MQNRFHLGLAATATMLLLVPLQLTAQESPLKLVPAKTPIVVQLHGLDRAKERLTKMLQQAVPNEGKMIAGLLDFAIQGMLKERKTTAIKKDQPILVLVNDLSTLMELPEIAVVIPTTGYAEFKESFLSGEERKSLKKGEGFESFVAEGKDEPMALIDLKSHTLVASDRDVAKAMLKKFESLDGKISAETKKAFLDPDLAVYVNLQSINDAYGATIKQFKGLIELVLNMGGQGIDKKQIDMIKSFFDGVIQVFDDGQAAVLSLDFRPEGLAVKLMAQFLPKTETSNFLSTLKLNKLDELGALPSGQMSYSAMRLDPKVAKSLMSLLEGAGADDDDDKIKKAIEEALEGLNDAGLESTISASSMPAATLEVSQYKNPEKAVSASLKLMQALGKSSSFQNVPLKSKPEIKEGAETFGKFKLHAVKLSFDMEKALAELPEGIKEATKASMLRMLGGETVNVWMGTDGKNVVSVTAKDWKTAKGLLEQYADGAKSVAKDESYLLTRKNLPTESTMVTLFDGAQLVFMILDMFKEIAQAVPGFPGALPELKPVEGKPAYLGFSLSLKPEHAGIDLFVPVTAVQQIRKLLQPLIDLDR